MPNDLATRIAECQKNIDQVIAAETADLAELEAHYNTRQQELGVQIDPVSSLNSMVADVESVKSRHRETRQMLERQFAGLVAECTHIGLVGLTAGAVCPTCGVTL
jgi:DNA repair exonuclease SbcCD ATPase subunit